MHHPHAFNKLVFSGLDDYILVEDDNILRFAAKMSSRSGRSLVM
jgi:hypothetical protein